MIPTCVAGGDVIDDDYRYYSLPLGSSFVHLTVTYRYIPSPTVPGGVVLVSHDQYFVSRVAKEVWVVEKGKVTLAESFDSYREAQMNKLK